MRRSFLAHLVASVAPSSIVLYGTVVYIYCAAVLVLALPASKPVFGSWRKSKPQSLKLVVQYVPCWYAAIVYHQVPGECILQKNDEVAGLSLIVSDL